MRVRFLADDSNDPFDGPKEVELLEGYHRRGAKVESMWVKPVHLRYDVQLGEIMRGSVLMPDPRDTKFYENLFRSDSERTDAVNIASGDLLQQQLNDKSIRITKQKIVQLLEETFLKFFTLPAVHKRAKDALEQLSKRPSDWQSTDKAGRQGYKKVFTSIERYSPLHIRKKLAQRTHHCLTRAGLSSKDFDLEKIKNDLDTKVPWELRELQERKEIFRYGWWNLLFQDLRDIESGKISPACPVDPKTASIDNKIPLTATQRELLALTNVDEAISYIRDNDILRSAEPPPVLRYNSKAINWRNSLYGIGRDENPTNLPAISYESVDRDIASRLNEHNQWSVDPDCMDRVPPPLSTLWNVGVVVGMDEHARLIMLVYGQGKRKHHIVTQSHYFVPFKKVTYSDVSHKNEEWNQWLHNREISTCPIQPDKSGNLIYRSWVSLNEKGQCVCYQGFWGENCENDERELPVWGIIVIVVASVLVLIGLFFSALCWRRNRREKEARVQAERMAMEANKYRSEAEQKVYESECARAEFENQKSVNSCSLLEGKIIETTVLMSQDAEGDLEEPLQLASKNERRDSVITNVTLFTDQQYGLVQSDPHLVDIPEETPLLSAPSMVSSYETTPEHENSLKLEEGSSIHEQEQQQQQQQQQLPTTTSSADNVDKASRYEKLYTAHMKHANRYKKLLLEEQQQKVTRRRSSVVSNQATSETLHGDEHALAYDAPIYRPDEEDTQLPSSPARRATTSSNHANSKGELLCSIAEEEEDSITPPVVPALPSFTQQHSKSSAYTSSIQTPSTNRTIESTSSGLTVEALVVQRQYTGNKIDQHAVPVVSSQPKLSKRAKEAVTRSFGRYNTAVSSENSFDTGFGK